MNSESRRRILLVGGGAIIAFLLAVLVQYPLLTRNVTASVAETIGVVVGVAVAVPLLQAGIRPLAGATRKRRAVVAGASMIAGLLTGLAVAAGLIGAEVAADLHTAGGAGGAYAGAATVRSIMNNEKTDGQSEPAENDADGVEK